MSYWMSYAELQRLSDAQLIERHDSLAGSTVVGTQAYLDELRRRQSQRVEDVLLRHTRTMTRLTWVIAALTLTAVIASIASV